MSSLLMIHHSQNRVNTFLEQNVLMARHTPRPNRSPIRIRGSVRSSKQPRTALMEERALGAEF